MLSKVHGKEGRKLLSDVPSRPPVLIVFYYKGLLEVILNLLPALSIGGKLSYNINTFPQYVDRDWFDRTINLQIKFRNKLYPEAPFKEILT
jgi:hypothetical protein